MAGFLELRIDFLLFLHGTALALLASSALGLSHLENRRVWNWLGLFGVFQAAFVWSEMVRCDFGESHLLLIARAVLLIISFFCLAQFARRKLHAMGIFSANRWIHVAAPILLAVGLYTFGTVFLKWAVPILGTLSGAAAGLSLLARSRNTRRRDEALRLRNCATIVTSYTAVMSITAFGNPLLSDSHSRQPSWQPFFVAGGCALLAALACWILGNHCSLLHNMRLAESVGSSWSRKRVVKTAIIVVVLCGSWIAAERAVKIQDGRMREDILLRAQLVSAAVPPEHIAKLKWSEEDLASPEYAEIKNRMMALVKTNADMRFVMLTGLHQGKTYFLVDSEKPESPDYSPPGEYYAEAPADYLAACSKRAPFVLGPITDHWGIWITASVPIGEFGPDKRLVMAEIDITAANWAGALRQARLPSMLITLLITLLLITFFYTQDRIHESVASLTLSEQRTSSIVEGSPNCVQMFDTHGRCIAINQNGVNALERKREEIIGTHFVDIWPKYQHKAISLSVNHALKGHTTTFEANYVAASGETTIWRITLCPIFNARRELRNLVSIAVDVTDFRYSEKALVAAKESAEAANKAKSSFLAVMSHEIRTPLGGVISMLNVLRRHPMTSEQQLYTELAHENAESLLSLLDDILDAAKVEAGKLTIEHISFEPSVEFNRILEPMRIRTEGKGLGFEWSIAPDIPQVLKGDPTRLRQVLANLLSNALKFTEKGVIKTAINCTKLPPDKVQLKISVTDSGIGIPQEKLTRLFKRFEQADSSTTRRFGGTGLGLSIVKSLAELMGGDVIVESTVGVGTTFTFIATLGEGKPSDVGNTASTSTHGLNSLPRHRGRLHILYAEDDMTNQVAAEFLIKQMGHTIEFVENGKLAVEWLEANRAAVVLMDNRMPVMDGFQATQIIRDANSNVIDHSVYIIAATANASNEYRDRCLHAGMNDYLTKPLREAELHAALERAISHYEKLGAVLPPMVEEPHLHLVRAAMPPESRNSAAPAGLSADQLLAIIDEADQKPSNPGNGFSPEALERITEQFRKDAPGRMIEIQHALSRNDMATVSRVAHSLKSSARYIDLSAIAELGAEMERLADAGELSEVPELLALAQKELSAFLDKSNAQENRALS
ncbi:MAG: ATP-binding protein [Nibricoccus sp.]